MSAASNQRQQNGTKDPNFALQNAQAAAASELLQVYCQYFLTFHLTFSTIFIYNKTVFAHTLLIIAVFLIQ